VSIELLKPKAPPRPVYKQFGKMSVNETIEICALKPKLSFYYGKLETVPDWAVS
jgi:hypothetical protein